MTIEKLEMANFLKEQLDNAEAVLTVFENLNSDSIMLGAYDESKCNLIYSANVSHTLNTLISETIKSHIADLQKEFEEL